MIKKPTIEPLKPRVQSKAGSSRTLPPIHSLTSTEDRTPSDNSAGLVRSATFIEETKRQAKQQVQQPDQEAESSSKTQKVERVKLPVYPNISNMTEFRKRHKLEPKTKVYVVTGGYGDIKKALDKRGWVQNPDPKSRCFDLKWTIKSNEEEIPYLEDSQMVNHFEGNATFTSKVGLCRNLRNLIHFSDVDMDAFYPKCFDLSDEKDYDDFIEEFKFTKAESILKLYVRLCKEGEATLAKAMEETVQVAVGVCEKKTVDLDEMLEAHGEILPVKITDEEWKILSKDEITAESLIKKKFEARLMKLENGGKPKKATKKKTTKRKIIDAKALPSGKENLNKAKRGSGDEGNKEVSGENEEVTEVEEVKNELLEKVELTLKRLKEKNPQNGLIGDKNIWMLKPAGLSRGRGITCVKNLAEVMDVARKNANHWVVQKYIENPLIIHKRKFDIRQWVLVTDWNPLTIWFFEECYVRFSGDEYNPDDLENRYVHLTNNSVVKHLKDGKQYDEMFEQNMWRMETFQAHLSERFGSDVFNEIIKPKMKQAVIWSLESVQEMIGNRKSSFELYGYDFMVDEDFNVWLIEINLSPSLDYSTPVTKRLVKMVSEDTVKVVVDYGMSKKKKKSDIDTGLFTRIHKSKRCVEKPMNSYGLDLVCEGTVIEKPEKSS